MIINFRNSETSRIQKINLDAYKLTRTPMIKKKKKKPASAYLIILLTFAGKILFNCLKLLRNTYCTNSFSPMIRTAMLTLC
jgi:hypothetical protein